MNKQIPVNQQYLIMLLALLLVAKFILVPIIEWQDELIADTSVKKRQALKAERLLSIETELKQTIENLDEQVAKLNTHVPKVDEDNFKINTQKSLVGIFNSHKIKIERAAWLVPPDRGNMYPVTIQLSLSGRMSDFLASHYDIEANFPAAKIEELRININRHLEKSMGTFKGRISLKFFIQSNA
ncbi:hypothetical protein [Thalassotalea euphylliae]|uniref:Uncharacterized protein n=1 Tax=Thalassotalea euphylliae TaxID=1655234 RepID=A0A3E0UCZ8_9GAMM|nr:hypothetical protein [Thalassotalea euphylliae]REL34891.1 hypothetical protein DXX92_05670 [Thalassotalea euphylliae]